jgi:hypothetical protein
VRFAPDSILRRLLARRFFRSSGVEFAAGGYSCFGRSRIGVESPRTSRCRDWINRGGFENDLALEAQSNEKQKCKFSKRKKNHEVCAIPLIAKSAINGAQFHSPAGRYRQWTTNEKQKCKFSKRKKNHEVCAIPLIAKSAMNGAQFHSPAGRHRR